jgi:hypothetical protein
MDAGQPRRSGLSKNEQSEGIQKNWYRNSSRGPADFAMM